MGARRGELVALKFSDVDFEQSKITIERAAVKLKGQKTIIKPPKDYEVRTVTVNRSCLELIKLLKAEKAREAARLGTQWINGDWLFTTWNGDIMNPQTPTKTKFPKFSSLERNEQTSTPRPGYNQTRKEHPAMALILASGSPRRRELMALITPDYTVITSDVDEGKIAADTPAHLAQSLASARLRMRIRRDPSAAASGATGTVCI